ncbi:anthranilate synthase / indole-3-glycerol phosphate synthase [Coemansia sp. IMI 209128]|nr:anthranilate synthase / indole-3-glycerol phosphate synthase [Coemansia sp. RSA 2530]KAJ2692216.1 anthranilate synthase / indole-3-glycerol phosphate synthase [Coemansia sp. IMI 209128]
MSIDTSKAKEVVVKTCGVRTVEAAIAATEAGADVIGVIFAVSGRQIDIGKAQEIAQAIRQTRNAENAVLSASAIHEGISATASASEFFQACTSRILSSSRPLLAGVFQNQPLEHILHVARAVPLDLVQLHGIEPVDMAEKIPVPVIKVFHVDDQFSLDSSDLFTTFQHSIVLLDTKVAGTDQQGGKGVSFDWTLAKKLADRGMPFLMAGGLTPDNVAAAVEVGGAWGVDVSSGIETNKVKDVAKIKAFVNNAKGV